jgi:hypothetical protein
MESCCKREVKKENYIVETYSKRDNRLKKDTLLKVINDKKKTLKTRENYEKRE